MHELLKESFWTKGSHSIVYGCALPADSPVQLIQEMNKVLAARLYNGVVSYLAKDTTDTTKRRNSTTSTILSIASSQIDEASDGQDIYRGFWSTHVDLLLKPDWENQEVIESFSTKIKIAYRLLTKFQLANLTAGQRPGV